MKDWGKNGDLNFVPDSVPFRLLPNHQSRLEMHSLHLLPRHLVKNVRKSVMNASYAKWKVYQLRMVKHNEFATCYTVSVRERTCSGSILKATHHCLWDSLYPIATYFSILLLAQSLRQFEAWPWHMISCVSQVLYKHRSFYCCLRGFYLKSNGRSPDQWTELNYLLCVLFFWTNYPCPKPFLTFSLLLLFSLPPLIFSFCQAPSQVTRPL